MNTNEFDFELPNDLIAQVPIKNRDESRLMVIDKNNNTIEHKKFQNIIDLLSENDVLVLNDTEVIPARIIGEKEETGAVIEVLLIQNENNNVWKALVKPQKRIKENTIITCGNGLLKLKCIKKEPEGICFFELLYNGILYEILDELGSMPIPPYIREKLENKDSYQTVYAKNKGSVAAPTAGLHFTKELLSNIEKKGIEIIYITLHVGIGTFRPVSVENINEHKMHSEFYSISKISAEKLNNAIKCKKNIISVGTTTTRTLESVYNLYNKFIETSGYTDIFIYPGYTFKVVDSLITNFHLPKSTLIMLVSSLYEKEYIIKAYKEAIKEKYRFYSFGDSMFIKNNKDK